MKKNSMKWVALFTFAALMMGACNGGGGDTAKLQSQVDSLRQADEQHKSELNDMVSFVDALTEGLDAISVQEQQLFDGSLEKKANSREEMLKRLETFSQTLSSQRNRIKNLTDSLQARGAKIGKLQSLVTLLNQQIDEKDKMISDLRTQLNNKDVDIAKLKDHVGQLTKANQEFAEYVEGQMKAEQEKTERDNAVYVVVGSSDVLKQAGITSGGGFLSKKKVSKDMSTEYFTKKDMRNFTQLEIPSAKPKIISNMPKKSYKIEKTGKDVSVLTITDPATFWSQTRYLVVQTK
jgi:predicted RNase H-like nuclease (RuvC/YqgF family)